MILTSLEYKKGSNLISRRVVQCLNNNNNNNKITDVQALNRVGLGWLLFHMS